MEIDFPPKTSWVRWGTLHREQRLLKQQISARVLTNNQPGEI